MRSRRPHIETRLNIPRATGTRGVPHLTTTSGWSLWSQSMSLVCSIPLLYPSRTLPVSSEVGQFPRLTRQRMKRRCIYLLGATVMHPSCSILSTPGRRPAFEIPTLKAGKPK